MRIFTLCALCLCCLTGVAGAAGDIDLNVTPWGQDAADTYKALGLPPDPEGKSFAVPGDNYGEWKTQIFYLFREGKLALIERVIAGYENPQMDELSFLNLYEEIAEEQSQYYQPVYPQFGVWETSPNQYAVLALEQDNDGHYLILSHMPGEIWEKYFLPKIQPELSRALQGMGAQFEFITRMRILDRADSPASDLAGEFFLLDKDGEHEVFTEYYRRGLPYEEAIGDAQEVAAIFVEIMKEHGLDPKTKDIVVYLDLFEREEGISGREGAKMGRVVYDPDQDAFSWVEALSDDNL